MHILHTYAIGQDMLFFQTALVLNASADGDIIGILCLDRIVQRSIFKYVWQNIKILK